MSDETAIIVGPSVGLAVVRAGTDVVLSTSIDGNGSASNDRSLRRGTVPRGRLRQSRATITVCLAWRTTRAAFGPSRYCLASGRLAPTTMASQCSRSATRMISS